MKPLKSIFKFPIGQDYFLNKWFVIEERDGTCKVSLTGNIALPSLAAVPSYADGASHQKLVDAFQAEFDDFFQTLDAKIKARLDNA